jgi:pSer/pThr/pTyr-binding forkhead associated (FHA) protein
VGTSVTVGRGDEAELSVDDAGVSRLHARLENRGTALWVTDLASRNGTFVDGEALASGGAAVQPGSVIRVGQTLLVVCADVSSY